MRSEQNVTSNEPKVRRNEQKAQSFRYDIKLYSVFKNMNFSE